MKNICLLIIFFTVISCGGDHNNDDKIRNGSNTVGSEGAMLEYAKGFRISSYGSATLVEVLQPYQGAKEVFKYLLVQKGEVVPKHGKDTQVVRVPVDRIVCTSTTHIPLLDYLGETDRLVGFPTTDYISSPKMRERIDSGLVEELGIDKQMNIEKLIALDPELVMTYSITGNFGQVRQIQNAGVPVVLNAEYLEEHPLGRAEWIKFVGLFFNKSDMADSVFQGIKNNYLQLEKLVDEVDQKPSVFSGVVYGDIWYMPGGENNVAKMFDDAGANYLWRDDETKGYLEYSFESVYDKANDADYWIGVASFNTLNELREADQRYADFEAFRQGNVYNYNARMGAKGGSEYLELGYLRPDLILQDLIKIFHPQLVPDHELFFHKKLID